MTLNEIKKALLKQNPTAKLEYITNGAAWYATEIDHENGKMPVSFKIYLEETFGGYFYSEMSAKTLLRWIYMDQLSLEVQVELGE